MCVCTRAGYLRPPVVQPHCETVRVAMVVDDVMFGVIMIHQGVNYREIHQVVIIPETSIQW